MHTSNGTHSSSSSHNNKINGAGDENHHHHDHGAEAGLVVQTTTQLASTASVTAVINGRLTKSNNNHRDDTMLNGFTKTITNNAANFLPNGCSSLDKETQGSDTQNNNMDNYLNVSDLELETPGILRKMANLKLQPPSPAYDRYPKVGAMKVYPITTPDRLESNQIDNTVVQTMSSVKTTTITTVINRDRNNDSGDDEDVNIQKEEQERLDEILLICTEYEKQNQTPTNLIGSSSPIVQNRIKTNGSLPRDKKTTTSPTNGTGGTVLNFEFDKRRTSEYENVTGDRRYMNLPLTDSPGNNGYDGVAKRAIPQSPRTRIRTCLQSPKREEPPLLKDKPVDFDRLTRRDVTNTRKSSSDSDSVTDLSPTRKIEPLLSPKIIVEEIKKQTESPKSAQKPTIPPKPDNLVKVAGSPRFQKQTSTESDPGPSITRQSSKESEAESIEDSSTEPMKLPDSVASEYDAIIKSFEDKLKMEIEMLNEDAKQEPKDVNSPEKSSSSSSANNSLEERQRERAEIIKSIRHLKTLIGDLHSQEEEVMREMDVEKALVAAELLSEDQMFQMYQQELTQVQNNLHRAEAQRNSNRVMQETNQYKLKQAIEVKQEHLNRLEKLLEDDLTNKSLLKEREKISDELDNDRKTFEDLEFQYLEEESEWLAHREEMLAQIKKLNHQAEDKSVHIQKLKRHDTDNQRSACLDTRTIEKQIFDLLKDLEVNRERLKMIDKEIYEISGKELEVTDTEEELLTDSRTPPTPPPRKNITAVDPMSQSLFGAEAFKLSLKPIDLMSQSMNEELLSNKIETSDDRDFSIVTAPSGSTEKKTPPKIDVNQDIADLIQNKGDQLRKADESFGKMPNKKLIFRRSNENVSDPLLKLKYKLEPELSPLSFPLAQSSPAAKPQTTRDFYKFKNAPRSKSLTREPTISTESEQSKDASEKVKESIKEIEKSRKLLFAQQSSSLIEYEKRSNSTTRTDGPHNQHFFNSLPRPPSKKLEILQKRLSPQPDRKPPLESYLQYQQQRLLNQSTDRPLSEVNSECSFEGTLNDFSMISSKNQSTPERKENENRNSMHSENSSEGAVLRRNLQKHQRPLTRYMPIVTELNLREHIESAGHQIALCPHVFIDRTTCKGYLHKIGSYFGWSKRWFVLDREKRAFIYYSDKSEKKPRGGAYFTAIEEVYPDHLNTTKSNRPRSTFIVKTKKRLYHLQAPSDAAARIWIDAIITGAQGNLNEYYDQ